MNRHSPATLTWRTIAATAEYISCPSRLVNSVTQSSQRLISGKIDWRSGGDARLLPRLIRTEIAGKIYWKRRNTRGKCFLCRSRPAGFRRDRHLSYVFSLEGVRDRSFWVLKFRRNVHILFTSTPFSPC